MVTWLCVGCGAENTTPTRYRRTFCDRECWRKNGAGRHLRTGRDHTCKECSSLFYARGAYENRGFCSRACYLRSVAVETRMCPRCGGTAWTTVYCSRVCWLATLSENRRGVGNPNWGGGVPIRRLLAADKEWRRSVFVRDDWTCQVCGSRGGRLVSHHTDAYHWCVERRHDITNGVTLCLEDHIRFHTKYGTHNNTEAQWLQFKAEVAGA